MAPNGQFIIVLPGQDAVIAITAEASNMQSEFNTVWKYLLPAFKTEKLSRDSKMLKRLNSKIASLAVSLPVASNNTDLEKKISGKTFGVITNDQRLRMLGFAFQNGICQLTLTTDSATHQINFVRVNGYLEKRQNSDPILLPLPKTTVWAYRLLKLQEAIPGRMKAN